MSTRDPNDEHNGGGEPERDAWLSHALRHAPDADASPPSELSDTILRQARAAARVGASAGTTSGASDRPARTVRAAAWAWLARPPVAAGFASVMVAAVVGVVWWDQPLDRSVQAPPPMASARVDTSSDARAAPAAEPKIAPAPAPEAPLAERPAAPRSQHAANDRIVAEAAKPSAAAKVAQGPSTEAGGSADPQRDPVAARGRSDADGASSKAERAETRKRGDSADSAAAAAPTPFPERERNAAPAPAQAPAPAPPPAPAAAAVAEQASPRAEAPSLKAASTPALSLAPTPALALSRGTVADRVAKAARAPSPPETFAAIAREPQRWRWQRSAGVLPMTESLRDWLQRLQDTSGADWESTPAPPPAGRALRLFRDGLPAATLVFDAGSVWFTPQGPSAPLSGASASGGTAPSPAAVPTFRLTLSADAATTLSRALDLAAP